LAAARLKFLPRRFLHTNPQPEFRFQRRAIAPPLDENACES
jgi:hypothetical protein